MRHAILTAVYLVLKKDNHIHMIRRCNTGWMDGHFTLIAGHVDPDESFTQAMIREAKEEAGIDLTESDLKIVHMMNRKSGTQDRLDVYFTAENFSGELTNNEPHKCDSFGWHPSDKLPENTIPFVLDALEHIEKDTKYSEQGY